jgi:hypothetical protein
MKHAILTLGLFVPLFAAPAHAQEQAATEEPSAASAQLRPSFLYGMTLGEWTHGFGLNLEYRHFPTRGGFRFGGYGEGFIELDGAISGGGGVSLGWGGCGLDLGVVHRTEGEFDAQTFIQVGKSFTFGPAGIALRMAIPIATYEAAQGPDLAERGVTFSLLFSLGWSFTVMGDRSSWGCSRTGCGNWRNHE